MISHHCGGGSLGGLVSYQRQPVTLANGNREEMEFDKLLIAVGRKPNTEGAGLENTKVQLDRGFVKVDGWQRTV